MKCTLSLLVLDINLVEVKLLVLSRHYNSVAVQAFLEQRFPRNLIGSRDRITCPCHLPDFALIEFLFR